MTKDFKSFVGGARAVTLITTAAQEHKHNDRHTVGLKLKLAQEGFKVTLLDVEFEDPKMLRQAEVIVIMGGNPYYLLHHLKASGAQDILAEMIGNETPLYGISAGILVLMKSISIIDVLTPEMNSIKLIDKTGVGAINDIIIPHFDRFSEAGIITREKVKSIQFAHSNRLIKLGESQWIQYKYDSNYITGNWFEQPHSLQESIDKTIKNIQSSNVSQELDTEVEEVKLLLDDGEEDIDDWLKNLNHLKENPGIIHNEIALHTDHCYNLDTDLKNRITSFLDKHLTASQNSFPKVLVVHNTESEQLIFNIYRLHSPIVLLNRDGMEVNGEIIGEYQVNGVPIDELNFWDSPIDIDELFTSISSPYFYEIIGLRQLRIYQSLLKNIEAHIKDKFPDSGITVLIGKFLGHLNCA